GSHNRRDHDKSARSPPGGETAWSRPHETHNRAYQSDVVRPRPDAHGALPESPPTDEPLANSAIPAPPEPHPNPVPHASILESPRALVSLCVTYVPQSHTASRAPPDPLKTHCRKAPSPHAVHTA